MDYAGTLLTISGVLTLAMMSPGPNFAIVTSAAVTVSRRSAVLTSAGLAAASATWALLAVAGLGILVARFDWASASIKCLGATYLIWLGIKMIRSARQPMSMTMVPTGADGWAAVRKGYFVSMTNPKAVAFYGSIFAVMVPAQAPGWFYAAVVIIAAAASALWYCSVALAFSHPRVQRCIAGAKTVFEASMGVVLIGLGGRMLFSR